MYRNCLVLAAAAAVLSSMVTVSVNAVGVGAPHGGPPRFGPPGFDQSSMDFGNGPMRPGGPMANQGQQMYGAGGSMANRGQQMYGTGYQATEEIEQDMSEIMKELAAYFDRSIADMENLENDLQLAATSTDGFPESTLVDDVVRFVEDSQTIEQLFNRLIMKRTQFVNMISSQMSSLPMSENEAGKFIAELSDRLQQSSMTNAIDDAMTGDMSNGFQFS